MWELSRYPDGRPGPIYQNVVITKSSQNQQEEDSGTPIGDGVDTKAGSDLDTKVQ